MKLCIISSAGGHFLEINQLKLAYSKYEHYIVTILREDTRGKADYYITDIGRNPVNAFINAIESLRILLKENPTVIITTGAGTVIFSCLFGKMLGKKIIFLESFCRTRKLSFTGKILKLFADKFLVQWKELAVNKAEYWGKVI